MSLNWLPWTRRPKPYRERDFRRRLRYRSDYLMLAHYLLERLEFESAFDVGCANGFLLEAFAGAGKEVAGIEASPDALAVLPDHLTDRVTIDDFAAAVGEWDLVCCVEVAEHIEPARSQELVATLSRLARRWIYFTAAPPGQAGHGHINCRPHREWLEWLEEAGWREDSERTAALRSRLDGLSDVPWLRRNSYVLAPES